MTVEVLSVQHPIFVILFQVEVFSAGNVHKFKGRGSSMKLAEVFIILWLVIGYIYKVVASVVQAWTKLKLFSMVLFRWLLPSVPSDGLIGRQNSGKTKTDLMLFEFICKCRSRGKWTLIFCLVMFSYLHCYARISYLKIRCIVLSSWINLQHAKQARITCRVKW